MGWSKVPAIHDEASGPSRCFHGSAQYCSRRWNQTISTASSRHDGRGATPSYINTCPLGDAMSNPKEQVRIKLTPDQKAQVKAATSKDAEAIELTAAELEERIAPMKF